MGGTFMKVPPRLPQVPPVNDSAGEPEQTENRGGTKVGLGWNLWKGSTSLNPFIYRCLRPLGWNVEPFHDFCR